MEELIYILVRGEEWRAALKLGSYTGSADDHRDGFLHFSTAAQVRASAQKHRMGERDLWLIAVTTSGLGNELRWEPASGGNRSGLFPHLFGILSLKAVAYAVPLPLGPEGQHTFPEGFT